MSEHATATRLTNSVARERLKPKGFAHRRGTRIWYQDLGWWVVHAEFGPARHPGTHLSVGAMWLWHERDYWTFDEGDRLHWRGDGSFVAEAPVGQRGWTDFLDFRFAGQFAADLDQLMDVTLGRAEQLRTLFATPCEAARHLSSRPTRGGESAVWHLFHAGAAAALCGDAERARDAFARVTAGEPDPQWAQAVARRAGVLRRFADDPPRLRREVEETIRMTRRRLGLPGSGW